ncbi:MAG: site-2 protease family protein [Clostridiales bacterium]|jgi:stage IV sporulation protein FB|nr:site-2 protease family protein [Clostridiales bacterium]
MKIRISPLVFLMAAAAIYFGYGAELASYAATVILHEAAHAEAAKRLGYSLNTLSLRPYGASLTGAFEGVRRSDEALIALAGPLMNLILATFFTALWWLIPAAFVFTQIFVAANVCTALFNLLPIFPLDGGRAALALLSLKFRRERVYKILRVTGIFFAAAFCALFMLSLFGGGNFSFALIAVFIFASTVFPDKNSKYQRLYSMAFRSEKLKSGLKVAEIMVGEDATLFQLMRMLNPNYYHRFIIVDASFNKKGELTESEIETAAARFGGKTLLKIILSKNIVKNGK